VRFADVLPHLEAGRRVRRASWPAGVHWYANSHTYVYNERAAAPLDAHVHLLASDWEVVKEPAPAKPECLGCGAPRCGCERHVGCIKVEGDLRSQVARLTRELREANDYAVDFKATVERLTRERDEARADAIKANTVCMSGWGCVLRPRHLGQCRDSFGNNHGTPGVDTL
jgi:hypothetical protein